MKLKLKKGLDLKIAGKITDMVPRHTDVRIFAVAPDDFPGLKPKVDVKEGDAVIAGSPLMHDKHHEEVKLVAPVSGTIKAVVRGERRKVIRVEIEKDDRDAIRQFDIASVSSRDDAMRLLAEAGLLAEIRQRPYDIVPNPEVAPRDIFVTAIDSAPLAVSPELSVADKTKQIQSAIDFLGKVTDGKIYISVRPETVLPEFKGAVKVEVTGAHPAGNAGVQAANIAPVNKGETIWTLDIVTLTRIGGLVMTGKREFSTIVAVTGPEVAQPCVITTFEGAQVAPMLKEAQLKDTNHHIRIISGNVLTGVVTEMDGFIHFPYRQLTVIAEGDDKAEFMGWASFSPAKASVSPTFPGHFSDKAFVPDARLNGGRRAMIMSGEYDKVIPMDILPEYLLKAIIGKNIDAMEKLGIYEIAPEDFGAAEYVDTSKLPLQQIVRDGLDYMREALE
ncbi:MAG: Na(+)-translocating NADH-quinone reductase subunit A [Muribaculaceae bacterium]|nr:Na(+)-translocating NADH-quinone reductase subunit A [Muribaculaceae bacterium]